MRFTLLLWLFSLPLIAQSVRGRVITSEGEPLANATVYFDGTTIGGYTGSRGEFALASPMPGKKHALVVSFLGYQTVTLLVDDLSSGYAIVLQPAPTELSTFKVVDANLRAKTLAEFRAAFLGTDAWGRNASILNEEVLRFDRDRRERDVSVPSKQFRRRLLESPRQDMTWAADSSRITFTENISLFLTRPASLQVDLPDLGYLLRVELLEFRSDRVANTTSYLGRFYFQPAEGRGGKPTTRHRRNRERAYYGSPLHFVRSLGRGRLAENGFSVLKLTKTEDRERVDPYNLTPHLSHLEGGDFMLEGIKDQTFDIIFYHDRRGRPVAKSRWKRALNKQSMMLLTEDEALLRINGSQGDSNLRFGGWMAERGAAWLLPTD